MTTYPAKGADAFHGGFAVGRTSLGRQIVFQHLALFVQRGWRRLSGVEHGTHAGVPGAFADDGVEYAVGRSALYRRPRKPVCSTLCSRTVQFLCPLHSVTAANEHLHPLVPCLNS